MKPFARLLAVILCVGIVLSAAGCSGSPPEDTAPTEATLSVSDAVALYSAARDAVRKASALSLSLEYTKSCTFGGETYTETGSGSLTYTGFGTGNMKALLEQKLSFGTYENQYWEFYTENAAYCRVNNRTFTSEMTEAEFLSRQFPAALPDPGLYAGTAASVQDGITIITFSSPTAPEEWIQGDPELTLLSAEGTAELDEAGTLLRSGYQARYQRGTAEFSLAVTVAIAPEETPDPAARMPVIPENCTRLSYFDTPRLLLQTVGNIYSAEAITASSNETVYSELLSVIRVQTDTVDTWGSGADFMAKAVSEVGLTNYTNTTTTNSQVTQFRNGRGTYAVNGAEPAELPDATGESIRQSCEDVILRALMPLDALAEAEVKDTGDFLCVTFTGTEDFADSLCRGVYGIFQIDMDSYSSSHTTESVGGYLCVSKSTALPTSLGVNVVRNHVADGITYRLEYTLDLTVRLSSSTAYQTITGERQAETQPEDTATPLFYRVTDGKGGSMWLLGTVHVGDVRTGFLPEEIYDALDGSDALAVEYSNDAFEEAVASDQALALQLVKAFFYLDGTQLADHIDEDLLERVEPLMLASGMAGGTASCYRAVIWWNLLSEFFREQDGTLTSAKGVDQRLLELAQEKGKKILEIESGLSQIRMLADFSEPLQAMLLSKLVDAGAAEYCRGVRELYELWCRGDEAALMAALYPDESGLSQEEAALTEEYDQAMFSDRNARMLEAARTYLSSGETVFYAVGLAHLLGEGGLIARLRDAGFTVEQVVFTE